MVRSWWLHGMLAAALFIGCGGSDDRGDTGEDVPCVVGTNGGCGEGEVCEEVLGGDEPACFAPAYIAGRVFDLMSDGDIEGARVVAMDANGAARSDVAVSDVDGTYALSIRIPRDADGNPRTEAVTLRVSAEGYVPFPKLPRTALPVALDAAVFDAEAGRWVVGGAATDVGLLALDGDTSGLGSITGQIVAAEDVEGAPVGGVLVVAEVDGVAVATAVTDADGHFVLFNVPAGEVTLVAYAAGVNVEGDAVTVAAGTDTGDITLSATTGGLSRVTGSVQIVDGGGNSETSVILIAESTLEELIPGDASFVRGEAPQGLRAGNVSGSFAIEGVPPGRYAVLAAFENDGLTRDPDQNRAGTDVLFIEVRGDGGEIDAGSFKVTQAVDVVGPGATGLEGIDDSTPTFRFQRMSNVSRYELRVFDAYGGLVYEVTDIPQPGGGAPVSHTYAGPDLEPGMIYQFRVIAVSDTPRPDLYRYTTEDMLGVFAYGALSPAEEPPQEEEEQE